MLTVSLGGGRDCQLSGAICLTPFPPLFLLVDLPQHLLQPQADTVATATAAAAVHDALVTASHRHGPHSSVHMAPGTPVILHGLTPSGEDWQKISTTIRDVSVYVVPAYHDKSRGMQRGKNAIFVFKIDDICIAHLGDLGHVLTPDQLKMMGKIDILLVPIAGGYFTVTPSEAREVTKLVNPKIAIPKHFWWDQAVQEYTQGLTRVKMLSTPVLKISKQELPQPIETMVMPWGQR